MSGQTAMTKTEAIRGNKLPITPAQRKGLKPITRSVHPADNAYVDVYSTINGTPFIHRAGFSSVYQAKEQTQAVLDYIVEWGYPQEDLQAFVMDRDVKGIEGYEQTV